MSLLIPIFVGGGEGGGGLLNFRGGGGGVVKKRESPDFRSPEVGISAYIGKTVYKLFASAVRSPAEEINILVANLLAFAHRSAKNQTLVCVELKNRGNNHSF